MTSADLMVIKCMLLSAGFVSLASTRTLMFNPSKGMVYRIHANISVVDKALTDKEIATSDHLFYVDTQPHTIHVVRRNSVK